MKKIFDVVVNALTLFLFLATLIIGLPWATQKAFETYGIWGAILMVVAIIAIEGIVILVASKREKKGVVSKKVGKKTNRNN